MREKYTPPDVYKVVCRFGRWTMKSERFYTGESVQEIISDFYYAFAAHHCHARSVVLHDIQIYNKYAERWESVIDQIDDFPGVEGDGVNVSKTSTGKIKFKRE